MTIKLWQHQEEAVDFAASRSWRAMLAMEMGCGKTIAALECLKRHRGSIYLVLCPNSVKGVWSAEVENCFADQFSVIVPSGSKARRAKQISDFIKRDSSCKSKIVVLNYESYIGTDSSKIKSALGNISGIICDESHRVGNHKTKISAAVCNTDADLRLALTGTPIPGDPLKLYGQLVFVQRKENVESFAKFKNRYALLKRIPTVPVPIVCGYVNLDELRERLGTISYQCKSSEVLELPPVRHQFIDYEASSKVKKSCKSLRQEMFCDFNNGIITADNALVSLLRLQQVTNGTLRDDSGKMLCNERVKALKELLEGVEDEPVVVFCRFTSDLDAVKEVSESLALTYHEVSGRVNELTSASSMRQNTQVLGVQLQAGSEGISLVRARLGVFFSKDFSFSRYAQACARLHRPKQTRPVMFYHLRCNMQHSFDFRLNSAIENKHNNVQQILKEIINEQ